MAKKITGYRLDTETLASLERLQTIHGAANATEAVADAVARLEAGLDRASREVADLFAPEEWNMMASIMNGAMWETGRPSSGQWLAIEVHDGHTLNGEGYNWLIANELPVVLVPPKEKAEADRRAADLVRRLAELNSDQSAAVAYACRWFWVHASDERVTLESPWYRVEWRETLKTSSETK
jgi:hypothetical protein